MTCEKGEEAEGKRSVWSSRGRGREERARTTVGGGEGECGTRESKQSRGEHAGGRGGVRARGRTGGGRVGRRRERKRGRGLSRRSSSLKPFVPPSLRIPRSRMTLEAWRCTAGSSGREGGTEDKPCRRGISAPGRVSKEAQAAQRASPDRTACRGSERGGGGEEDEEARVARKTSRNAAGQSPSRIVRVMEAFNAATAALRGLCREREPPPPPRADEASSSASRQLGALMPPVYAHAASGQTAGAGPDALRALYRWVKWSRSTAASLVRSLPPPSRSPPGLDQLRAVRRSRKLCPTPKAVRGFPRSRSGSATSSSPLDALSPARALASRLLWRSDDFYTLLAITPHDQLPSFPALSASESLVPPSPPLARDVLASQSPPAGWAVISNS